MTQDQFAEQLKNVSTLATALRNLDIVNDTTDFATLIEFLESAVRNPITLGLLFTRVAEAGKVQARRT